MWYSKPNNRIKLLTIMLFCLISVIILITQLPGHPIAQLPSYPNTQPDLSGYLPLRGEIGSWQPTGSPEQAVGEDLFVLINGGAEIYHEYGFKRVIMQSYENNQGKSINLEIYEMNDSASAFGIYSFKTGKRGKPMSLGDRALLEDYYLNCWKGNFLITVTGFDSEPETIDGLVAIARAVDSKIKTSGQLPELVKILPTENLNPLSVKYLKGNLALFNNADFGPANIFGLKQGVLGEYDNYRLFIFKYDNSSESEQRFKVAREIIRSKVRFDVYDQPVYSEYSILVKGDQRIFLKCYRQYIIVVVGTASTKARKIIGRIEANIIR